MKVNFINSSMNFKQNSKENKTNDGNVVYLNNSFLNEALEIKYKDSFLRLNDEELNKYQNAINKKKQNETLGAVIGALSAIPISFISTGIITKIHKQKFDTKTAGIISLPLIPVTLIAGYLVSKVVDNKTNPDTNLPYQKYVQKIYKNA